MERHLAIHIGRGVGPIRYGMSRVAVAEILGRPQRKSIYGDFRGETWEYLFQGLEVDFDEDESDRVVGISVLNGAALLDGQKLVGISEVQMKAWMLKRGHATSADVVGHLLEYDYEQLGLTFYVEHGHVSSVHCSPIWDAGSDQPIWPVP